MSNMKAVAIALTKSKGVAKKTNKPFDMQMLSILIPNDQVATENYSKFGKGFQVLEMPVSDEGYQALAMLEYPVAAEFTTGMVPRFGRMETMVTGITGTPRVIDLAGATKA